MASPHPPPIRKARMSQIYLAINYGPEGWRFESYDTPNEALQAVKDGDTHGQEWKILKELDVKVEEES